MQLKREVYRRESAGRAMKIITLRPKTQQGKVPGILWIHGGGYIGGSAEMIYLSCGRTLAKKFGAVVLSPEYRLAGEAPYPAALEDCYAALLFLWENAERLGVDRDRIVVGGESAGGGLATAVCLYARDHGVVPVKLQLPIYPMLDCEDTESSRDNHGRAWNTEKNHLGWKSYLGALYGSANVPKYASPARESDYSNLPECYTFVCDGEPFFTETLNYVRKLQEAGVPAAVDVYPGDLHGFDMIEFWSKKTRRARGKLCEVYEAWLKRQ